MPTTITGLDGGPPVPVTSALVEFGSALHVLRDPAHHGAGEWAAGIWAGMSPALADRTRSWWWTTQAIRSVPFVTATPPGDDFGERLEELRAMPARRLAGQLLRPVSRSGDASVAVHWSRSRGPAVRAVVDALATRPQEGVAEFTRFLEQSWREWFGAEWSRIRPTLAARARLFAGTVASRGAAQALATLDPSVTVSGSGVGIAKVRSARYDVSRRGLLVAPSSFIRPHLYVADVPGRQLMLIHPAQPEGPAVPPVAELLSRLEVLAHRGRLEVARAIATEPRTAGEIAALWGMDPTLVNRHLRALAAAGLARPVRRGRFVRYQLDVGTIGALGTDVVSLLLR